MKEITWSEPYSEAATEFWQKVAVTADPTRCWNWTMGTEGGYGRFRVNGTTVRILAHRAAWQIANRQTTDLDVLHSCDNPLCCNPQHLRAGTHAENMWDMYDRNREVVLRGSQNGQAKITENEALVIHQKVRDGVTTKQIAQDLNISPYIIADIRRGRTWRHLKGETA